MSTSVGDQPQVAANSGRGGALSPLFDLWRRNCIPLGILFLAVAAGGAAIEWPIYLEYETSWEAPAQKFASELAVSILIALGAGLSPSLSLHKGSTFHWLKLGAVWLILSALWMVFGLWGPNGVVCVACLLLAVISLRPR